MVDTNPKKKTPTKVKHWLSTLLLFFIGFIVLLLLASMIVKNNNDSKYEKERAQMEQYLEDKYSQEFVVEEPVKKASGLGVEGYIESKAYSKTGVTDKFTVRVSSTDKWDDYQSIVWVSSEKEVLKKDLYDLLNRHIDFKLSIGAYSVNKLINGSIPTFDEAVKKFGSKITYNLSVTDRSSSTSEALSLSNRIIDYLYNRKLRSTYYGEFHDFTVYVNHRDMKSVADGYKSVKEFID